jgi:hypothetical protein
MDVKIQKSQTGSSPSQRPSGYPFHRWVNYYCSRQGELGLSEHRPSTRSIIDPTVQEVVKAVTARYTAVS